MEQFLTNMLHTALWFFGIVFLFAVIGVIATIGWIVNLFRKTEQAVESGVHNVENRFHHSDGP